jgi:hypothetical protein
LTEALLNVPAWVTIALVLSPVCRPARALSLLVWTPPAMAFGWSSA